MSSTNIKSPSHASPTHLPDVSSQATPVNADDIPSTESFSTVAINRFEADNEQNSEPHDKKTERGSLLLELPAELRNTIYELALITDDESSITIPDFGHLPRPALLKVCQQITTEASCIYYSINRFHSIMKIAPLNVFTWATYLGQKERESITALELECVSSAELERIIDCYARAVVGGPAVAPPLPADEYKRRMGTETNNIHKEHLAGLLMLVALGIPLAALQFLGPAPAVSNASPPIRTVEATKPWLERNVLALLRSRLENEFGGFFEAVGGHVKPLLKAVGQVAGYAELNESSKAEMCFECVWRALSMAD